MSQGAYDSPRRDVPQLLKDFAALDWYEAFISFLVRFAAKTSEPLLALGLISSAANVLSRGLLANNNVTLNLVWAVSQAVAMESSGGVVLVHGLQARSDRDEVKAWLYFLLSTLLALAGSVMLFMQLAGWEQQGESALMLSLFALRGLVSVGYIYLCRAKHLRLSGTVDEPQEPASLSDETMPLILSKLAKRDALEQALNAQVGVSDEPCEPPV